MPMNNQLPEKETTTRGTLEVVSVFFTIQGEGPFAGRPAVFVRLAGCNLKCPMCDTNYTVGRKAVTVGDLVKRVASVVPKTLHRRPVVVITGGEPFRQNLGPFVLALNLAQYQVQVETNGTIYRENFPWGAAVIVCSPKAGQVAAKLWPHIAALKYVAKNGAIDPADGLPTECLGRAVKVARPCPSFTGQIYLQPLDEGSVVMNKHNVKAVVDTCIKYGYTLCLQLHKVVGLE